MLDSLKRDWPAWVTVLGLVAIPFVIALLTGSPVGEGQSKFWLHVISQVLIFGIYAISYDLLLGYTGILSFGHAAFFGGGAYTAGILLAHVGVPFVVALLGVVLVALLQGVIVSVLALRVKGVYFALLTLAFAQVLFILAEASDFQAYTGADEGLHGIPVPRIIDPTANRLNFFLLMVVFFVVMYWLMRRFLDSPTGHVFVAIRENEGRAEMIGYNTALYKSVAIVISAVFAGLAGSFNALLNNNASPSVLGVNTTIDVLLMTIIGGIGTLIGPVLGAAALEIGGNQWLKGVFGANWELVFGIVYILLVLFLPYGIVGTWRMRRFAWRQGWQRLIGLGGVGKGDNLRERRSSET